jgi:hypothetical protein
MYSKKIINQLLTTEASLEITLKEVRKSRKMLEGVDSPASPGAGVREQATIAVMKNIMRKRPAR